MDIVPDDRDSSPIALAPCPPSNIIDAINRALFHWLNSKNWRRSYLMPDHTRNTKPATTKQSPDIIKGGIEAIAIFVAQALDPQTIQRITSAETSRIVCLFK